MRLGNNIAAMRARREGAAQAGRTQGAVAAQVAAGANPDSPAVNVAESPTVPASPLFGGDGDVIDEGTATGPFTPDSDVGGAAPEVPL
jgi:hypothetical protein